MGTNEKHDTPPEGQSRVPILKITTLGVFSVELDGVNLSEDARRQQQIWVLFKYIIISRRRRIPPEEFHDILWRDESVENPAKALQNLIYRLRRVLSQDNPDAPRYILLKQGCYCWNPDAPVEIDIDQFEALNLQAMEEEQEGNHANAVELYKQCLELYKGDYLSESSSVEWIIPTANYYKRLYINITTRVTQLLKSLSMYEEMLSVCEAAFRIEPYEEPLHASFIQALLALGRPKQARSHYESITAALYREYGVKPSQVLKDMYRYITENVTSINMDLDILQELLAEKEQVSEAFQCEPELFRSIYKLEARRAVRNGQVVYLVLMTILSMGQIQIDPTLMAQAMNHMNRLLLASLRRGDVVSQWNESQFVIMLASLTYEDGEMVFRRIQDKFGATFPNPGITVKHRLQPLNAIF